MQIPAPPERWCLYAMKSMKVIGEKLNETVFKRAMKSSSLLILEILHKKYRSISASAKAKLLLSCREQTNESWSELIAFSPFSIPLKCQKRIFLHFNWKHINLMQLQLYLNLIQPRLTCLADKKDKREDIFQASKKKFQPHLKATLIIHF